MDERQSGAWRTLRSVLVGLTVLLVLGVGMGALVGGLAAKALHGAGLNSKSSSVAPTPSLRVRATSPATPPAKHRHKAPGASLSATPRQVSTLGRINLDGRFPAVAAGQTLKVQRKQGSAWVDFPVTMTSQSDGSFHTYIQTGQTGVNIFRVLDAANGRATSVVRVQVG